MPNFRQKGNVLNRHRCNAFALYVEESLSVQVGMFRFNFSNTFFSRNASSVIVFVFVIGIGKSLFVSVKSNVKIETPIAFTIKLSLLADMNWSSPQNKVLRLGSLCVIQRYEGYVGAITLQVVR
jgi:hypothetical protein